MEPTKVRSQDHTIAIALLGLVGSLITAVVGPLVVHGITTVPKVTTTPASQQALTVTVQPAVMTMASTPNRPTSSVTAPALALTASSTEGPAQLSSVAPTVPLLQAPMKTDPTWQKLSYQNPESSIHFDLMHPPQWSFLDQTDGSSGKARVRFVEGETKNHLLLFDVYIDLDALDPRQVGSDKQVNWLKSQLSADWSFDFGKFENGKWTEGLTATYILIKGKHKGDPQVFALLAPLRDGYWLLAQDSQVGGVSEDEKRIFGQAAASLTVQP